MDTVSDSSGDTSDAISRHHQSEALTIFVCSVAAAGEPELCPAESANCTTQSSGAATGVEI